ncbi:MAG TPA: hypothetical protein VF244_01555 [Acidimicrobiales bacterium]
MAQPDRASEIKACALRVARLAADGTTPAGATNGYITKNLITLTKTPDIDEGTDYSQRNACGETPYPVKDRPTIRRYNLALTLEYPDPELFELLLAHALILSTPAAPRTPTGNITTGSFTVSNISGGVTNADVGATIAATGIPAATTTIVAIESASSVTISAAAIATTVGVTLTITPAAQAIGNVGPALGIQAADFGSSLELFSNAYVGGSRAPYLPFIKSAFTRTYWQEGDRSWADAKNNPTLNGYADENLFWGNGPWNDWGKETSSATVKTLSRAFGWHRVDALPVTASGYTAVPTQI